MPEGMGKACYVIIPGGWLLCALDGSDLVLPGSRLEQGDVRLDCFPPKLEEQRVINF